MADLDLRRASPTTPGRERVAATREVRALGDHLLDDERREELVELRRRLEEVEERAGERLDAS